MIKDNITNDDYHSDPSIGSTTLKYGLHSMAKLHAKLTGQIPEKRSTALDIGTSAHAAILEKDISGFMVGPDVSSKASKKWKDFVKDNENKIVLLSEEYAQIKGMYDAFFAHEMAAKVIKNGRAELSAFTEILDVKYKARFDYIIEKEDSIRIVDYKTTRDANPESFSKAIYNYRYDISAAHYIEVAQKVFGKPVSDYIWIAQEKEAPFEVCVYRADPDLLARANKKVWKLYEDIKNAFTSDRWPGREAKVLEIDIPGWAQKLEEDE